MDSLPENVSDRPTYVILLFLYQVRHEAGEALGAIGDEVALEVLKKHLKDPVVEVAETCELAVERIEWLKKQREGQESLSDNPYNSVDPAPPSADAASMSTEDLKKILVDEQLPLFRRYRSMFELRNRGGSEAVAALCAGLLCKDSALFRHEIAYVLGQMQHPESLKALEEALIRDDENEMVRKLGGYMRGTLRVNNDCLKFLETVQQ